MCIFCITIQYYINIIPTLYCIDIILDSILYIYLVHVHFICSVKVYLYNVYILYNYTILYKHYTNIILYSFYIRQYIVYILSACGLNMFSEGILV